MTEFVKYEPGTVRTWPVDPKPEPSDVELAKMKWHELGAQRPRELGKIAMTMIGALDRMDSDFASVWSLNPAEDLHRAYVEKRLSEVSSPKYFRLWEKSGHRSIADRDVMDLLNDLLYGLDNGWIERVTVRAIGHDEGRVEWNSKA